MGSIDEAFRQEPAKGPIWIHLGQRTELAIDWLQQHSALDAATLGSFVAEARRPQVEVVNHDNVILVIRTPSLEGAASTEVGQHTRIWLSPLRVITIVEGHHAIFDDCAQQIESGSGPRTVAEWLERLMDNVIRRAEMALLQSDGEMTDLELDQDKGAVIPVERPRAVRLRATLVRRAMMPYRESLVRLKHLRMSWLNDPSRAVWDSLVDDATEVMEELGGLLERSRIAKEAVRDQLAINLNQRVYVLTLVSGIVLPLTFLTGLLGVNLGGIPGARNEWGFADFCVLLAVVGLFQYFAFRRMRWWG